MGVCVWEGHGQGSMEGSMVELGKRRLEVVEVEMESEGNAGGSYICPTKNDLKLKPYLT